MKKTTITHLFNINGSFVEASMLPTIQEDNAAGINFKYELFSYKFDEAGNRKYLKIGELYQLVGDVYNIHIFEFRLYGLPKPVVRVELLESKKRYEISYNEF